MPWTRRSTARRLSIDRSPNLCRHGRSAPWWKPCKRSVALRLRLLSAWWPKSATCGGSDLSILSDTDVQGVEDKLNSRPRKILGYQTPREVFFNAKNLLVALHC